MHPNSMFSSHTYRCDFIEKAIERDGLYFPEY